MKILIHLFLKLKYLSHLWTQKSKQNNTSCISIHPFKIIQLDTRVLMSFGVIWCITYIDWAHGGSHKVTEQLATIIGFCVIKQCKAKVFLDLKGHIRFKEIPSSVYNVNVISICHHTHKLQGKYCLNGPWHFIERPTKLHGWWTLCWKSKMGA